MRELADIRFADPAWLYALWGLPVVVLLYLIRRRASRLMVPHLPIWEDVIEQMKKRRRWTRTLLSILLQLLLFATAILAGAGPYVEERRPGVGHTVIVVDRSLGTRALSSSGRPLNATVAERARELMAQAVGHGTVSVAFLQNGVRAKVPATRDIEELRAPLEDPGIPSGRRDWREVAGLRAAVGQEPRIVVVTPFAVAEDDRAAIESAGVVVFGVGGVVPQAGIVEVRRTPEGLRVVVQGRGPERELALRRGPDSEPVVRVPVTPSPSGTPVTVPVPVDVGARPDLELLPYDGFRSDDRVPLVLPERERIGVLVVSDTSTPWLDAWLRASEILDPSRSNRTRTTQFREWVDDYDVTILVDDEQELPLPGGRYLLLGSGAPDLPISRDERSVGAAEPVETRAEDPLVRALDLSRWRVHEVVATKAGDGLDVIVRGTRGPLVSRGETSSVRFIDVAVRPDPRTSTLPLLAAFPLMLEAAVIELVGRDVRGGVPVLGAGRVLTATSGEDGRLFTESGAALPRLARSLDGTGFVLPERPGRYLVGTGDDARTVAVGLLDHPGRPTAPAPPSAALPPFPDTTVRVSFRSVLLWALAGLLALEWWLWHLRATD